MTTQADYIIERFGGISAMARVVCRTPSVVQGWKERGTIPARHYPQILEGGIALVPPLSSAEFVEDREGTMHSMAEAAE